MKSIINACEQIGDCCVNALISEVSASPKPGLVDRINSGAHRDMDFSTFMKSIEAISSYFSKFAQIGCSLGSIDENTLEKIRPVGIECEKVMFNATCGINTHKGAIFSMGILSTAAGYCYSTLHDLNSNTVCSAASVIAKSSEKDFLIVDDSDPMTKGRQLYVTYGIWGVRGEASSGFVSVRKYALPVMRELYNIGCYSDNDIYLQALLHLMTQVVDTNVISRCGIEAVEYVKSSAKNVLTLGGALTQQGREELFRMDKEFIKHNISPGGCADLLSVTITLYTMENLLQTP